MALVTQLASAVTIDSIDLGDNYYLFRSLEENLLVQIVAIDRASNKVKIRYDNGAVDWVSPSRLLTRSEAEQRDNDQTLETIRIFGCMLDAQSCKDSPWTPGAPHPTARNVIASDERDNWRPDAGYSWDDPESKALSVHWVPGRHHTTIAHVLAATGEGRWIPEPGYVWQTPGKLGPVNWSPGLSHSGNPNLIAGATPGKWKPAAGYRWKDPDKVGDYTVVPQ